MSAQAEQCSAETPTVDYEKSHLLPWGLTRMTPFPGVESVRHYCQVVLDPVTQTAHYLDEQGQDIEMGKHATPDRQFATRTEPAGPDGGGGQPPGPGGDPDSVTDYESE